MSTPTTISLHTPGDLINATPYILGYRPEGAIVTLAFKSTRLIVAARIANEGSAHDMASSVAAGILRAEPDKVLVHGYGVETSKLTEFGSVLTRRGIEVDDIITIADRRWTSLLCPDGCCIDQPIPEDVVGAEFALMGRAPVPSRADVERAIEAGPDAVPAATLELHEVDDFEASWEEAMVFDLTPEVAGRIAQQLQYVRLRDLFCCWVTGAAQVQPEDIAPEARVIYDRLPVLLQDDPAAILERLMRLGHLVTDEACPDIMFALANYAWLHGEGAVTTIALARGLRANPEHRACRLLDQAVQNGVRP